MKMYEENVSLVMLSRNTDVSPDVECQKIIYNEYRHKKFKRIASVDIEDDYNQEEQLQSTRTHIQSHINETKPNIERNEQLTKEERQLYSNCRFVFKYLLKPF